MSMLDAVHNLAVQVPTRGLAELNAERGLSMLDAVCGLGLLNAARGLAVLARWHVGTAISHYTFTIAQEEEVVIGEAVEVPKVAHEAEERDVLQDDPQQIQ